MKANNETLSAEYIRAILDYDPETGEFRWKRRPREHFKTQRAYSIWNARFAGTIAGTEDGWGYLTIRISGRLYQAHRLAWLWMTGEWPADEIDHINLHSTDNRWSNLRQATRAQNEANKRAPRNNTSGFKGVCRHKQTGKWRAYIKVNSKQIHLGCFETAEEAWASYERAAREKYGEFARAR